MGIDDQSSHPALCSEVAGGVTRTMVCLFREPDAGNPPVRFAEREQETELCQTGLRRPCENFVSSHRKTNATAPVLDSTQNPRTPLWCLTEWDEKKDHFLCRGTRRHLDDPCSCPVTLEPNSCIAALPGSRRALSGHWFAGWNRGSGKDWICSGADSEPAGLPLGDAHAPTCHAIPMVGVISR